MEIKYQCQAQIQKILEGIKPHSDVFDVSKKYLYGLDNDTFVKGFYAVRKILISVYQDMLAVPEEYGLILVDMDISEYKNSQPRASRASALRLMALLYGLGRAGELVQNELHITAEAFQEIATIKYTGFSWMQNASMILNKLMEFGFTFIGLKGKSFDKKADQYVLSYPDNPAILNVLKGYAMSVPVLQHFPKELIYIEYYTLEDAEPDEPISIEFSLPLKDKEKELLKQLMNSVQKDYIDTCKELIEYTLSLGYLPHQTQTGNFCVSFTSKKINRTIITLAPNTGLNHKKFIPRLRILFSATKDYSSIFQNAVKDEIESIGGIYVGCFGCGKCRGEQDSYIYIYPDGRSVFKCCDVMMAPDWRKENIPEIKEMMKTQHDYWLQQI